jgi:hypothetical protein
MLSKRIEYGAKVPYAGGTSFIVDEQKLQMGMNMAQGEKIQRYAIFVGEYTLPTIFFVRQQPGIGYYQITVFYVPA